VQDTLKQVDQGRILNTVDREGLWQAQTPQGARRNLLEQAMALARQSGFQGTDEASLLEHAQIPVRVVMGSAENFKITRPADMELARALWRWRQTTRKNGHGIRT
jgi:2-C-methyl-D-erythritol 4-phosphate cytidylyltransferase